MKRVFTVGVYDLLHIGHVELFRRAREIGDHLTVAVQSSDVVLKSVRYVDRVVEYRDVDKIVEEVDFDVFAVGPDQCHEGFQRAMAWCREHGKEVVVLPRTEGISSSWLKERIHSM